MASKWSIFMREVSSFYVVYLVTWSTCSSFLMGVRPHCCHFRLDQLLEVVIYSNRPMMLCETLRKLRWFSWRFDSNLCVYRGKVKVAFDWWQFRGRFTSPPEKLDYNFVIPIKVGFPTNPSRCLIYCLQAESWYHHRLFVCLTIWMPVFPIGK